MTVFPITQTRAQKIEREAKRLRKADPALTLPASRDLAAQKDGFLHWQHVALCRDEGAKKLKTLPLPPRLLRILGAAKDRFPVSEATINAFNGGIVVAVDVNFAEALEASPLCSEIADGWPVAATTILPAALFGRSAERPNESDEQRMGKVLDDFTCLRFFRVNVVPSNDTTADTLQQLVGTPIQWCWIKGKATRVTAAPWVGPSRTRVERFRHLMDAPLVSLLARMRPAEAEMSAFLEEKKTPLGSLRYRSVSRQFEAVWGPTIPVHSEVELS